MNTKAHHPNASEPGRPRCVGTRLTLLRRLKIGHLALIVLCALTLVGCRRDMQDQPRYEVYEKSDFFKDRRASRNIPEHAVPRGYLREDDVLYTGKVAPGSGAASGGNAVSVAGSNNGTNPNGQVANRTDGSAAGSVNPSPGSAVAEFDANLATTFPFPVTREVLDRGEERFRVFCIMCHGLTGAGDGMVVRRGYKRPTSYHDDRLRRSPVGHFFDVITNGWGTMPNYAAQVTPRDRWAIVAYIRVLQLSQGATLEDIPEEERQQLVKMYSGLAAEGQSQQHSEGGEGR